MEGQCFDRKGPTVVNGLDVNTAMVGGIGDVASSAACRLSRQSAELQTGVPRETTSVGSHAIAMGLQTVGQVSKHLPPMEIKDMRFDAIASSMLYRLDANDNGVVTRDELKDFIDHPTRFDKQSTRDAVKLMYDNYQFLRELSPGRNIGSVENSPGINATGIHRAYNLANGRGIAPEVSLNVGAAGAIGGTTSHKSHGIAPEGFTSNKQTSRKHP